MALLLAGVCAATALEARADEFSGEKTLGLVGGYNTFNREPEAGIEFSYRFNRLFRLAPAAQYVFRRDGRDALKINLDAQFIFPLARNRVSVFPYCGFNYSSWNYHRVITDTNTDDVSSRESKLGVNVGAGIDTNITGSLRLSLTGGYTFIDHFHGADILVGIHYRF